MSNSAQKPVAWARKWFVDGERPFKVKNEKTKRMGWHRKFMFHSVTSGKIFDDDVPLFTAPVIRTDDEEDAP